MDTYVSSNFIIKYSETSKMNKLMFKDDNFNTPLTEEILNDIIGSKCKKIDFPNNFNNEINNLPDDIINLLFKKLKIIIIINPIF